MAEPRWLTGQELAAWESFLLAGTILNRRIEQQLKEAADLSHSQYEVLARLSAGDLRMTELAGMAHTSKSGLTYQVAQLEKAGLVRRITAPGDDRGVIATLTAKGRRTLEKTAPGHAALVRELFLDGLSEREFAGLAAGIQALRKRLLETD